MSNKFKTNLLAIMVTVAPYQECHYHANMPLEFLRECFEQFSEGVCGSEFYSKTAKLGGYTEREFYNLIEVGLTNKTTKKGQMPSLQQIINYVNGIVTPLQEVKNLANAIAISGQMAVSELELSTFNSVLEQYLQIYVKEALTLNNTMQREFIKIAKKRSGKAWGVHHCLFKNKWCIEFAVKTLLAQGWQKGQAKKLVPKLEAN